MAQTGSMLLHAFRLGAVFFFFFFVSFFFIFFFSSILEYVRTVHTVAVYGVQTGGFFGSSYTLNFHFHLTAHTKSPGLIWGGHGFRLDDELREYIFKGRGR